MKRDNVSHTATLLLAVCCFSMPALAPSVQAESIVLDTFFPGDDVWEQTSQIIGNNFRGEDLEQGIRFEVPGTVPLSFTTLVVAVRYSTPGFLNQIDFHLRPDVLGEPGAAMETLSFSNVVTANDYEIRTGNSLLHPILLPGEQYWITASAPGGADGTMMNWIGSLNSGLVHDRAIRRNNGPWQIITNNGFEGAVRITAVQVPEPASFVMTMLGLVGLLTCAWWRRKH